MSTTRPTSANSNAKLQPEKTTLELRCVGGIQSLVNLNFPRTRSFEWSPETCEDVTLVIEVGDVKLTKKYKGSHGFADFLNDFKGGRHVFYRKEFPGQQSGLKRLGIEYIKLEYRFKGHKPVLDFLKIPTSVPRDIARCWDQ